MSLKMQIKAMEDAAAACVKARQTLSTSRDLVEGHVNTVKAGGEGGWAETFVKEWNKAKKILDNLLGEINKLDNLIRAATADMIQVDKEGEADQH